MAKKNHKEKEAAAAADPAAAEETAARLHQAAEQSGPQGGADPEQPGDTGMDQGDETRGADTERLADLNRIAKVVFFWYTTQTLYFTSDNSGFDSRSDAEAHASTLDDPTITEIKRKTN